MLEIVVSKTDLPLSPAPITPAWIREGAPAARSRVIAKSADGTATTLVWDCTAGSFEWIYDIEETIHVLEGSAVLTDASGTRTIQAGDVVFFPAGSKATWRVDRYVRKVAVFRYALPLTVGRLVRRWHAAASKAAAGAQALHRVLAGTRRVPAYGRDHGVLELSLADRI